MTESRWLDDSSDDLDDDEFPEEDELDDESVEMLPCSECGEPIYEEAPQCPYCGAYVTSATTAWAGRPTWWIILGLLGLGATILALAL